MIKQDIKLAVDIIVFCRQEEAWQVLLVQRKNDPYQGMWSVPGGFVEDEEDLEPAAHRELQEETGLETGPMKQLYTFGTPGRDPRFRTVSVAYYTVLEGPPPAIKGADDAADARWWPVKELPKLAFDHDDEIRMALERLKAHGN